MAWADSDEAQRHLMAINSAGREIASHIMDLAKIAADCGCRDVPYEIRMMGIFGGLGAVLPTLNMIRNIRAKEGT